MADQSWKEGWTCRFCEGVFNLDEMVTPIWDKHVRAKQAICRPCFSKTA